MIRNNMWHYIILFLYIFFILFCCSLNFSTKKEIYHKKDKLDLIIEDLKEIKYFLQNNH